MSAFLIGLGAFGLLVGFGFIGLGLLPPKHRADARLIATGMFFAAISAMFLAATLIGRAFA